MAVQGRDPVAGTPLRGFAVGGDLRLPTGREEDLLGSGDMGGRALVIGSWERSPRGSCQWWHRGWWRVARVFLEHGGNSGRHVTRHGGGRGDGPSTLRTEPGSGCVSAASSHARSGHHALAPGESRRPYDVLHHGREMERGQQLARQYQPPHPRDGCRASCQSDARHFDRLLFRTVSQEKYRPPEATPRAPESSADSVPDPCEDFAPEVHFVSRDQGEIDLAEFADEASLSAERGATAPGVATRPVATSVFATAATMAIALAAGLGYRCSTGTRCSTDPG